MAIEEAIDKIDTALVMCNTMRVPLLVCSIPSVLQRSRYMDERIVDTKVGAVARYGTLLICGDTTENRGECLRRC